MKVALITGGSRGIGAAIVKKFAEMQYTVILNYCSSLQDAQNLRGQLLDAGCDVHLYKADVSNSNEVSAMFEWIKKYFKKLDVLINNAGVALTKQIQDVTESEFDKVTNVNAKGSFLCCQQALPLLKASGSGAIVNVSSIWGIEGASCESVYAMSKFAIVGLTKSLAEELKFTGITVNCICPPIVYTDMTRHLSAQDVQSFCNLRNLRAYTPDEVANDIYTLATCDVTGKVIIER